MQKIRVRTALYQGAPTNLSESRFLALSRAYKDFHLEDNPADPDIIFFLSGGSEMNAISRLNTEKHYLLIAGMEDNAYAAAAETSAWMRDRKIQHTLLENAKNESTALRPWFEAILAHKRLKGQKLGLIGNSSPWLIASMPPKELIYKRFGIELITFPWEDLPEWKSFPPSLEFLDFWKLPLTDPTASDAARFHSFLLDLIQKEGLDAVSVECFPMAVEHKTTACLSLALLNEQSIVASCEGDLDSSLGMMLARSICPDKGNWMANLSGFEGHQILFSHCTIAPRLNSSFKLTTHFETDCSFAVQGRMLSGRYTAFRMNDALTRYIVFEGRKVPKDQLLKACRTQLWIELDESQDTARNYMQQPLGNHHILIPGDHAEQLNAFFHLVGMKAVKP